MINLLTISFFLLLLPAVAIKYYKDKKESQDRMSYFKLKMDEMCERIRETALDNQKKK